MRKSRYTIMPSFTKRQRRALLIGMALSFLAGPVVIQVLFVLVTRFS
jgi:hypothetical protein